ncbi:MAG: RNA repair transcriptional activator RtcR [Succinivibrio sp.]|nr:RNA repair transcriptional activator RtcR [Succinivibrio sp.]
MARLQLPLSEHNSNYIELKSDLKLGLGKVTTVVIGLLGTVLDNRKGKRRWDRWRPTVSIGQHDDLYVDRLEILHQSNFSEIANIVKEDFEQVSPHSRVNLHEVLFSKPWDFETVYKTLLDFAKDYKFDLDNEEYLVHITTGTHVMQICLFLLVESRIIPAKILQTGVSESKDPAGIYSIIDLDLSAYDKLAERFATVNRQGIHYLKSGIPTRNAKYNALIETIAKVSSSSSDPILITGPSGVGKTRLAHLIYEWKKNNHIVEGAFVELNCATLKGTSAMSALFGHTKGAYTGADEKRKGLLSLADGGLLFLDEIGELGLDEQAMLLRAIEEKRFYPLGSDVESSSNFQLICGTNRDLKKLVQKGLFREDLLFRINLWTFELMGLKDRSEDIEPNLDYELERVSTKLGKQIRMNKEAREMFLKKATSEDSLWTGNFRELSGAATRMATLSQGGRITVSEVNDEFEKLSKNWNYDSSSKKDSIYSSARKLLGEKAEEIDLFELSQLDCVINVILKSKSLSEAGRKLFANTIKQRKTSNDSDRLRKYLEKYNLDFNGIISFFDKFPPN